MAFLLDWEAGTTQIDGTNTLTDPGTGDIVNVIVSTPNNAGAESFSVQSNDPNDPLAPNVLGAFYPDRPTDGPTEVSMDFDQFVQNVTFSLYDVDTGTGTGFSAWDDEITILATRPDGSLVTITFDNAGNQIVNGNVITGDGTTNTPRGDTVDVTIAGPLSGITIIYDNGPTNVSVGYVGIGDISFDLFGPLCFTRGTMLETDHGEVVIEDLKVGDMVRTLDNGMQPIRWIGSSTMSATGSNAPILFRKGAIGNTRDLLLSPAHRVLLQGWRTELLFGENQMLASAKSLVNDSTIIRQAGDKVEYFHVLFDQHEIVFSDGAPTESFHPADLSVDALAVDAREEIYRLFPQLQQNVTSYGPAARETLMPHEIALMNA
ncbi:MAG: Hint domain-containing protein [Rhodobacteraceae bacterium]|nr:Hint domain-containing protein [Paracoccaceae bacterium]